MMKDVTPSTDNRAEQNTSLAVADGVQGADVATAVEPELTDTTPKASKRRKTVIKSPRKTTKGRKTSVYAGKTKTSASPRTQTTADMPASAPVTNAADVREIAPPRKPRPPKNISSTVTADIVFCLIMGLAGIAFLAMRGELEAKYLAPYQAEVKRLEIVVDPSLAKKKETTRVYHTGFTNQQPQVEAEPEPEPIPPSPQEVAKATVEIAKVRVFRDRLETYFRRAGYASVVALIVAAFGVISNILLSHRRVEGYSMAWVAVVLTTGALLLMVPVVIVPAVLKVQWVTALLVLALLARVCWNSYYGYSLYCVKDDFAALETTTVDIGAPAPPHRTGRTRSKTSSGRNSISLTPKQKHGKRQTIARSAKR